MPILAEQGIELVVNEYSDYVVPNTAVEDGDEDANYFQHLPIWRSSTRPAAPIW